MSALKQERTTKNVLDKDGRRQKKRAQGKSGSEVVSDNPDDNNDGNVTVTGAGTDADTGKKMPEDAVNESGSPVESGASDIDGGGIGNGEGAGSVGHAGEQTSEVTGQQQQQDSKEERSLFSPEEAESLTSYLVDSQQAFSLINVADIQRGEVINVCICGHNFDACVLLIFVAPLD